ncbi:hypothetical protein TNCV_3046871 [Trichonephila clavipes]|nr:hypothetical protein TNCV_3046871 [Trichonephila clavipes]
MQTKETPDMYATAPQTIRQVMDLYDGECQYAANLGSTPILRENTFEEGLGASHLSYPATNLTARWLFRVPSSREGTIHLEASMTSPGFEPKP